MGTVADKGESDWFSEELDQPRVTYSCLIEKTCCKVHAGDRHHVVLSPKEGYGFGAVCNVIEESGYRVISLVPMPPYLPEETKDEPTG